MLTLAVDASYLATNPVEAVRTPRLPEPQVLFLDACGAQPIRRFVV